MHSLGMPQFGSEPKFEPELFRTGPKFGPRFGGSAEPNHKSGSVFGQGAKSTNLRWTRFEPNFFVNFSVWVAKEFWFVWFDEAMCTSGCFVTHVETLNFFTHYFSLLTNEHLLHILFLFIYCLLTNHETHRLTTFSCHVPYWPPLHIILDLLLPPLPLPAIPVAAPPMT